MSQDRVKSKENALQLESTLDQLKSALDDWQNISSETNSKGVSTDHSPASLGAVDNQEWRAKTRNLLEKLSSQLDDLSE